MDRTHRRRVRSISLPHPITILTLSDSGQHDLRVRSMGGPRSVDRIESAVTASTDRTHPVKAETVSSREEMDQKTSNRDST
jgi:hypothetical protein